MSYDLLTVLGPTATGKTNLATNLAKDFNGEIISADSRQVYKGMDIGTGKDLFDFQKNKIKYHLIDICEPTEEYNLFRFINDFRNSFSEIKKKNKLPVLVGGTGLYLSSVLQSYNLPKIENSIDELKELHSFSLNDLKNILINLKPELHNKTDLSDKERIIIAISVELGRKKNSSVQIKLKSLNIGIMLEREEIKRKITSRLKRRLSEGMIDEIKTLLQKGISAEKLEYFGLEYKFISQYINGKLNYNDMFQNLNSAIYAYAKRQMTWFRKMEREGVKINWFSPVDYFSIKNFVTERFNER
jgi:tRNA dimethylallyltransferase